MASLTGYSLLCLPCVYAPGIQATSTTRTSADPVPRECDTNAEGTRMDYLR